MTQIGALAEARIAHAILDWLQGDGLVDCYELDIDSDGFTRVKLYLLGGDPIEATSYLGPIEVTTDLARRLCVQAVD